PIGLEGRYSVVAERQHHIGLGAARHEMTKTRCLPLQSDLAQERCGGGVIVHCVIELESAGRAIAQHHVGGVGPEERAEPGKLPTACDLTQGVASEDRIATDVVDFESAVSLL